MMKHINESIIGRRGISYQKYELITDDTKIFNDRAVYRICAIKDIPSKKVKKGDLGGWIGSYDNLDQKGDCWVADASFVGENARVYGNAEVCDGACIYGNAQIYGSAKVCNRAQIYDDAEVYGNALVCNNAQIYGSAKVCGEAKVYGSAEVYGNAYVHGKSKINYPITV